MRVHVVYRLARVSASVEDHTVSGIGDAFSHCHLVRLGGDLGEQSLVGGGSGQIADVIARNHQHMNRRLWIYVAECERPSAFKYQRSRHLTGGDSAE